MKRLLIAAALAAGLTIGGVVVIVNPASAQGSQAFID